MVPPVRPVAPTDELLVVFGDTDALVTEPSFELSQLPIELAPTFPVAERQKVTVDDLVPPTTVPGKVALVSVTF